MVIISNLPLLGVFFTDPGQIKHHIPCVAVLVIPEVGQLQARVIIVAFFIDDKYCLGQEAKRLFLDLGDDQGSAGRIASGPFAVYT